MLNHSDIVEIAHTLLDLVDACQKAYSKDNFAVIDGKRAIDLLAKELSPGELRGLVVSGVDAGLLEAREACGR